MIHRFGEEGDNGAVAKVDSATSHRGKDELWKMRGDREARDGGD